MQKKYNRLTKIKNLNYKKREKRNKWKKKGKKKGGGRENSKELQKPNIEAEVYNSNKTSLKKKKKINLKSLIGFLSANKIDNYN